MKRSRGRCKYQKDWEEVYSWLQPAKDDVYSAKCIICSTTFTIESMGKTAVKSHSLGKKHMRLESDAKKSMPMDIFIRPNTPSVEVMPSTSRPTEPISTASTSASTITTPPVPTTKIIRPTSKIDSYLHHNDVTKAEILWACQTVMTHSSLRAAANYTRLFPYMFHDSEIAKKIKLQKDKLSYMIVYGLAPYFNPTSGKRLNEPNLASVV